MPAKNNFFYGGIHPTDGTDKQLSKNEPIKFYIPKTLVLNAAQTPSSVCDILVKKGDTITKGQLIAKAQSFTASDLHAPVSGVVEDVIKEEVKGKLSQKIVIKSSPEALKEEKPKDFEKVESPQRFSSEEIITLIKQGGLCGMGGAGFPTHIKLKPSSSVDTLLINAAECESYLTCDYRVMLEYPRAVLSGVLLLKKATRAKRAIICIEDNKADCAALFKDILSENDDIEIMLLPTRYPQGGERQLIQAATGRQVPMGGLPADAGVVVSNVQTAKAAADMIYLNTPLISRVITISGEVKQPKNFLAPIGTPLNELVKLCEGFTQTENKVVLGGPMTGSAIGTNLDPENVPGSLSKVSGGLTVLKNTYAEEENCIRCTKCAEICPAGLTPWKIDLFERRADTAECEALYATECIACGCCSYVCPAHREISFHTASARDKVKSAIRERGNK